MIGLLAVFLGALFADLLTVGVASAQVPNVTIGTNPAGTVFYAVGSGLAKVASESGKVKVVKAGGAAAVIEDGCFIAYDIYFGAQGQSASTGSAASGSLTWTGCSRSCSRPGPSR